VSTPGAEIHIILNTLDERDDRKEAVRLRQRETYVLQQLVRSCHRPRARPSIEASALQARTLARRQLRLLADDAATQRRISRGISNKIRRRRRNCILLYPPN